MNEELATKFDIRSSSDPEGPTRNVGSFRSPQTKQKIFVFAKKGESSKDAIRRVLRHHGVK